MMNPYLIAFITGITTGGLSCLAVQGGLLASSLAHQIERDMLDQPKRDKTGPSRRSRPRTALPIALFLGAKVIAYTLLGFLLGALGTVLTLTPTMRAVLLMAIGIFMIGNALRMFNIHPIFRYFALEPPKFITRYIRRTAKKSTDLATPLFLGALTVLIPCGVTQAMMAVAIATGSPLQGAGLMLAFTLGTSPVFFALAYLTTQIGARLEKLFMRFVAIILLVLGILTSVSGLRLTGLPVSIAGWEQKLYGSQQVELQGTLPSPVVETSPTSLAAQALISPTAEASPTSPDSEVSSSPAVEIMISPTLEVIASPTEEAVVTLTLNVQNNGYFPNTLYAKANAPAQLNLVTDNTHSCAIAFVIPALNYQTLLPVTGVTTVDIPPQPAGTVMVFTCSMGMYTGEIVFQ